MAANGSSGEGSAPTASGTSGRRDGFAVFLFGAGTTFGAGNVGPVVPELSDDFGLSLTSVGLIAGTAFYAATVIGLLIAPRVGERLGGVATMRLACFFAGGGSLLFALAPNVLLLVVGRLAGGVALGFSGAIGPVFARETGGTARVGVYGGSFQLGIGLGLLTGSALADAGVDWRVGFAVSALAGISALPLLARTSTKLELNHPQGGFLSLAVRSPQAWRLTALFVAMFSVPLTLGAWLVHYLAVVGDVPLTVAGLLSFVLFGASAALRLTGASLASGDTPAILLRSAAPLLATAGVAALAFDRGVGTAIAAVLLMAAGFALPYAVMIVSSQRLFPEEPADPVSLLTAIAVALPIAVIPLFGTALSDDLGEETLLGIAAFIAVAAALNLRPADRPLREAG